MNEIQFSVAESAAWAPGLNTIQAWKRWCSDFSYRDTEAETDPKLKAVSPLLRRRTDILGKMALEVAYECLGKRKDIPAVFCSRHGEVARSVGMLESLARRDPVSPTSFSLSVHNAIAGLFSITRSDQANNVVISAKTHLVESALTEACGILHDGAEQVLIVVYNNVLPSVYDHFSDRQELPFAWTWLIEKPDEAKTVFKLSWTGSHASHESDNLPIPDELNIWRFFLMNEKKLSFSSERGRWTWSRCVE